MNSVAHPGQESSFVQEGDLALAPFTSNHVATQQPVKKPTRQWAAWTHQEEQSFFSALRQVGKNFEKITCRVQSKNKDQVRHYYYRLVRRMNKLLGPGLYLDSRNSKDTNAAMLRWWSLLEKYSCKASKLHLKPRRFKIFMEALEHQLLKDRKKTVRKRPSQGENCPPEAPNTSPNQSRPPVHDRPVKLVLVESHNIQKSGPGKASLKRSGSIGVNRGNKGDASTMKSARQRRKPDVLPSTAAFKKWEKAAIAGVSLVADAAEQLERTIDKEVGQDKSSAERSNSVPVGNFLPSMPNFPQTIYAEHNIHNSMKLKLQLFPVDDGTRRALEMDKHNPHLELTLPPRKKISSVMEHLNRKWGSSSVASGVLMLFPNSVQHDSLTGYLRWTQDSNVSAGDVYAMIGSPAVFRLRYGWFSTTELGSVSSQASCRILGEHDNGEKMKDPVMESALTSPPSATNQCGDIHNDLLSSVTENHSLAQTSAVETNQKGNLVGESTKSTLWHEKIAGDQGILRHQGEVDGLRLHNSTALSAKEWADTLTNISVGDLLTGVPHDLGANCVDQPLTGRSQCLSQIPFSCDSFDAAIAAHISRQKNKMGCEPTMASHVCSIWDAEETCDEFVFQKNSAFYQQSASSSGAGPPRDCKQMASTSLAGCDRMVEDLSVVERPLYDPQGDRIDECQSDPHNLESSEKDFDALADIYWPESLAPLDLELRASKYQNEELILNDSLSGLNRLIASSLDAFQNCSFFGSNKKEPTPSVETRDTISFADFKIGNEI
ncbi:TSL-kinase interacting protein 1 isoform X2 [Argentina anserina]|uniref:TSL-kinase interacting protein 1 isoform X2 n=1 Tax=Argentina anserina TaxID=57926 RepID=UPI00217666CC|nr:TSL-kinase interacting protein 1 isoform X2 [Potentilla anserina]